MIDGVRIVPKRRIVDDRGAIFHMLRRDDPEFGAFGEIYFSKVWPGVVKAWHLHSRMTLNYMLIVGAVRLALYDDRPNSPSHGRHQELTLDPMVPQLVIIPPLVWNGFKGLGTEASIIANCASEPHSADEIQRRPHDDPYFRYDWSQRHC